MVAETPSPAKNAFEYLIDIVKQLRGPNGCPWDKEQTYASLCPHVIEEAYELVEALSQNNPENLKEELGDVLLHVVMLSCMAEETNAFTPHDVAQTVADKMISRHPHVFGDVKVHSVDDVWQNWEKIKTQEKPQGAMASVPNSLPALLQATKIQKRASRLGFDWPDENGPLEKIQEELKEFQTADSEANREEEAGDILFAVVNYLRKKDINPEEALRKSNLKFIERFTKMESFLQNQAESFQKKSLDELESLWQRAKKNLL